MLGSQKAEGTASIILASKSLFDQLLYAKYRCYLICCCRAETISYMYTHPNIHTLTMHTYIGKAIGKEFEGQEPKQQSYGAWHFFTIFLMIAGSAVVCYVCVHNRKRVSQQLSISQTGVPISS